LASFGAKPLAHDGVKGSPRDATRYGRSHRRLRGDFDPEAALLFLPSFSPQDPVAGAMRAAAAADTIFTPYRRILPLFDEPSQVTAVPNAEFDVKPWTAKASRALPGVHAPPLLARAPRAAPAYAADFLATVAVVEERYGDVTTFVLSEFYFFLNPRTLFSASFVYISFLPLFCTRFYRIPLFIFRFFLKNMSRPRPRVRQVQPDCQRQARGHRSGLEKKPPMRAPEPSRTSRPVPPPQRQHQASLPRRCASSRRSCRRSKCTASFAQVKAAPAQLQPSRPCGVAGAARGCASRPRLPCAATPRCSRTTRASRAARPSDWRGTSPKRGGSSRRPGPLWPTMRRCSSVGV
jgi:hypothetical protein